MEGQTWVNKTNNKMNKTLVKELSVSEMQRIDGGALWLFSIKNIFTSDCEVYLFGQRIYHGSTAPSTPQ